MGADFPVTYVRRIAYFAMFDNVVPSPTILFSCAILSLKTAIHMGKIWKTMDNGQGVQSQIGRRKD